jgi:hypothetical protein
MLKHPVPVDLLAHIGDITVSFALLESEIQSFLGALIREHQRVGQIIASQLSFARLRAATISLYVDRHGRDEDYLKLKGLMNEAGKIEAERDQIAHSLWGAGASPGTITRIKLTAREKRGFQAQFEHYDGAKLAAFATKIRDVAERLQRLQFELLERSKLFNSPGAKMWGSA